MPLKLSCTVNFFIFSARLFNAFSPFIPVVLLSTKFFGFRFEILKKHLFFYQFAIVILVFYGQISFLVIPFG